MEKMDRDEKSTWMVVRGIVALCLFLFTYYGFFEPQTCDIDREYLWCNLHPFTTFDLIGCVLFYGAAAVIAGVPKLFGVEIFNPTGSAMWNIITAVVGIGGVVLIWNL